MISRVLLPALVITCLVFAGSPAFAQTVVPGCNDQVVDAMAKKQQALVGYDISVVQQTMDKPDGMLAMSCFNKSAGLSAAQGGLIFSEDYMAALQPMVEPWLTAFYNDFDDASGFDSSIVAAYQPAAVTMPPNDPNCDYIDQWWSGTAPDIGYKNEGVQQGIPFITLEMLRGADAITAGPAVNPPWDQGGVDFIAKWGLVESINSANSDLDTALTALPLPTMPAGGFIGQNTVCAVLIQAGLTCP